MPVRLTRPYNGQNANTVYSGSDEAILRAIGIADDYVELASNYVPTAAQSFRAFASTFSTSAPVGATIATFSNPFAGQGRGSTTYALTGTVPGQIALGANQRSLVIGGTAAVAGTVYTVSVVATSGDGLLTTQPSTFSFAAIAQLALVGGGGGSPPTPAITVPAAPTLIASAGSGQNSLAWVDGATGGAPITAHKLYAGSAPGSLTLVGTIMSASPYIDTGLTNGTIRYYAISAVNSVGEGPTSAIQSATPVAGVVNTVLPVISGNATNGSTLTATPGTWAGSPTITAQWMRDGAAMTPTVTGLTYVYNSTTDDGRLIEYVETANGTTVARSKAVFVNPFQSYSTTFTAADNTPFNGFEGWSMVSGGTSFASIVANDLKRTSNGAAVYTKDIGSLNMDFTLEQFDAGNGQNGSERYLYVNYTDADNWAAFHFNWQNISVQKRVAGVTTDLYPADYGTGTNPTGKLMRVLIVGGYLRIFRNGSEEGTTKPLYVAGKGFDCTDVPASTKAALGSPPDNGSLPFPIPIAVSAKLEAVAVGNVSITSVANTTDLTGTSTQIIARMQGNVLNISTLQYAVLAADNTVIKPWTDVSVTPNAAYSILLDALPTTANGTTIRILARDPANKRAVFISPFVVPALQTIFPLRMGQQDGNYSYYSANDWARDEIRRSDILTSSYAAMPSAADGIGGIDRNSVMNSYPAGQTQVLFNLPYFYARLGVYTVKYPAGMGVFGNVLPAAMYDLGAEYVIDTNTLGRKLTVKQNYNSGRSGSLNFSGVPTGKTATTMGFRPSLTFDGDANPQRIITDEITSSLDALNTKIFRSMDARGINGNTDAKTIDNINAFGKMPLSALVEVCNSGNRDLWLNFYMNETDAAIRAECDYVAANLKPGLKLYLEYSNENWNTSFYQWNVTGILGMKAGLHASATSAGAVPIAATFDLDTYFVTNSGAGTVIPNRAFATGDRILGNRTGYGIGVWAALQPITANDAAASLPTATNAYWQIVNTNAESNIARLRWCSQRTATINSIAKAAYTAISRDTSTIVPVFAWQSVIDVGSEGKVALDFDNNYLIFKRYAIAPYWNATSTGIGLGNYGGADFLTWTKANKDLYLTDIPSCVTAFYGAANDAIDTAVSLARTRKNELANYLASKGVPVDSIPLASYEFNTHVQIDGGRGWTNSTQASLLADAIRSDSRAGTAAARYLQGYRAKVGGDACWYGRMGLGNPWGSQNDELDRTSPIMAALMANS